MLGGINEKLRSKHDDEVGVFQFWVSGVAKILQIRVTQAKNQLFREKQIKIYPSSVENEIVLKIVCVV